MNIKIRLAEERDVPAMLHIYAPFVEQTSVSFEEEVPAEAAFWERIEGVLREAPWVVCTVDERVVAYAYAGYHRVRAAYRWNRELSAYVHPDFRGRFIGGALYQALFAALRWQGYTNALAGIVLPNVSSVRFHERMGFRLVGIYHKVGYKLSRYWDVGWWEKPLIDGDEPPGEIRSVEALLRSDEWNRMLREAERQIRY